jgi:hypothetical protein
MTKDEVERQRRKIQEQLDAALEDSFPASDPVSIVTSQAEEDWGEGDSAPPPPGTPQASKPTASEPPASKAQ